MPTYIYQCKCGVRFEAVASMKDHQKPKECPSCKAQAPRVIPDEVAGVFNKDVTGPVPQNTGLASLDAHIDRVIGVSAKRGWDEHEKRLRLKKRVLDGNPGASPEALSRNPDGSYRPLSPDERGVHERANAINSLAMKTLRPRRQTAPR
jgi:putative FmdB family regulatory protein